MFETQTTTYRNGLSGQRLQQIGGDVEFEIGALASRHGLTIPQAREIVERCGTDLDCIDLEARKLRGFA